MNRLIIGLALLASLLSPLALNPSPAAAEVGCGVSAWMNGSATVGTGSFQCATDDNGNRQMQICVQEYWSRATYGCRLWNTWTYANTLSSYSYACTISTNTRQAWVWFKGEDGSTLVRVSGWYTCNAPPMGDVNLDSVAGLNLKQMSTLCCPGGGCTFYAGTPTRVGGWVTARAYIAGCGNRQIQVCVQLYGGGTAGCRTLWTPNAGWYTSSAYYSPGLARTWAWADGLGTSVSGYV